MRNTISGLTAVFAIAIAVTGCSSGSGDGSKVTLDGKDVEGAFTTTCGKDGDKIALALSDENNETYGKFSAGASLVGDGSTVSGVSVAGTKGGSNGTPYTLGFGQAGGMNSGGSAEVSVDGTTYTIKGQGIVTDIGGMQNMDPMDMGSNMNHTDEQAFEIVFACDKVIE